MLCHSYNKLYGVPFTILRYGIPYGPYMRDGLLISSFIKKALSGEPLTINGDGTQCRNFIYVEDLAKGNVAALAPEAINQTYNLEGSEKLSILQVAQAINGILGDVQIQFSAGRPGDLKEAKVSSEKALNNLGWRPQVPFEEGLRRTIHWFKSLSQAASTPQPATIPV